jgi:2-keto-4-pentenoate hydratase
MNAEAARRLRDCWDARQVIAELPERLRPRTRLEGYAVQAELSAAPVFGWKVAASSEAGQRHINVSGPLAGRIFADKQRPDGATVSIRGNRMRVAEVEFAFRMGASLPPRRAPYETAQVLAAVASLHPAIEVPDSRYMDFTQVGAAQLIADCACADQFVLGPATTADWRGVDLARHAVTAEAGGAVHRGLGANVLGDPRIALTWLVNELSEIGVALEAGQVVTTGTCVTPIAVGHGDRVAADFGAFGKVSASFADDGR